MTQEPTDGEPTADIVELLPRIVAAMAEGKDPIEDPSRDGGMLVDDEVVAIATDMESALEHKYKPAFGDQAFVRFNADLLAEISRASEMGLDPIEEITFWLEDLLKDETVLSA